MAKKLTYPERVNRYNMRRLQRAIVKGPNKHPGANYIRIGGSDGTLKSLRYGKLQDVAMSLRIGDVVERHLCDGDIVLFNRQPSLHKMSIMSHEAKILRKHFVSTSAFALPITPILMAMR